MLTIPERPAAGRHALSFAKKPHVTGITDRFLPKRQRSIDRAAASPIRPTGNASESIPWRWTGPNRALERPGLRSHAGAWERSMLNWFRARWAIALDCVEGFNNKAKVVTKRSY